ncbi:hypothetical protein [Shinella sp.]|jgi:hypothetical protein|uniref:hypothetical protein n=1 Tax=Shinella sp. TaxID=1870904 RepID=UPI003F728A7F
MSRDRLADTILRKLTELAGDDDSLVRLAALALSHLPYEQDEGVAGQLLMSILLHDDLAEALYGRL